MGREIRRVPANWEHPRYTEETATGREQIGQCVPLKDDYERKLAEFAKDIEKMGLGKAIDYWGGGPCSEDYVDYGGRERTWWQVYQTVSEGTPVTPPFATPEELVEYLVKNGDFSDQHRLAEGYQGAARSGGWPRASAEAFVKVGWAPSGVIMRGKFYNNADALVAMDQAEATKAKK